MINISRVILSETKLRNVKSSEISTKYFQFWKLLARDSVSVWVKLPANGFRTLMDTESLRCRRSPFCVSFDRSLRDSNPLRFTAVQWNTHHPSCFTHCPTGCNQRETFATPAVILIFRERIEPISTERNDWNAPDNVVSDNAIKFTISLWKMQAESEGNGYFFLRDSITDYRAWLLLTLNFPRVYIFRVETSNLSFPVIANGKVM